MSPNGRLWLQSRTSGFTDTGAGIVQVVLVMLVLALVALVFVPKLPVLAAIPNLPQLLVFLILLGTGTTGWYSISGTTSRVLELVLLHGNVQVVLVVLVLVLVALVVLVFVHKLLALVAILNLPQSRPLLVLLLLYLNH